MSERTRLLWWCCILPGLLVWATARADLADPAWYRESGAHWHYRVPIQLPAAAAIHSTIQFDVDFNALLGDLGIDAGAVTVDEVSPRIVTGGGLLAAEQQYTPHVYGGLLDSATNGRGEVRFIVEDDPADGDYWLYFDIVGNGAKPPNPAMPINGGFEHSVGSTPTRWTTSSLNTGGAENNEVHRTGFASTVSLAQRCSPQGPGTGTTSVWTSPNFVGFTATGQAWHLLGYRDDCEDGSGDERVRLTRNIAVPAGAAATALTFFFRVQGWDGIQNPNRHDWILLRVNGQPVDHTQLGIDPGTNPALAIEASRIGKHIQNANARQTYADHGWKQASLNLSPYAGSTISFTVETRFSDSDSHFRSWVMLDDFAWSVVAATLGEPEGFGVNVQSPNDTALAPASMLTAGEVLRIEAQVDAAPGSVFADIFDEDGVMVAAGVPLFDDGSHGDVEAGDRIWTNDGSDPSSPTYTIAADDVAGSNWLVRVFAPDASVSAVGADDGLVLRPGAPAAPATQASFFNIDEQTFSVAFTVLTLTKSVDAGSDPVSGAAAAKAIPGAVLEYRIGVENPGPGAASTDSVTIVDAVPAGLALCVAPVCHEGAAPVVFDDDDSPEPTGLSFDADVDVAFSTNGVDFDYTPAPDGAGFDPAVTHLRIAPRGAMQAPGAAGNPAFEVRYRARIE